MKTSKLVKVVVLGSLVGAASWVYKKYDTVRTMYNKVYFLKKEEKAYGHFDGHAMATMFSALKIDLTDTVFEEEEVYLDIYALGSFVTIYVPSHVEVICDGRVKASGVQIHQDDFAEKTVQLYLNYDFTASGLVIIDEDYVESSCCCCGDDHEDGSCCCSDDNEDGSCCCGDNDEDGNCCCGESRDDGDGCCDDEGVIKE